MEKANSVKELTVKSGKVYLRGWVHDIRDMGKVKFIQLRDSTGIVQLTILTEEAEKKHNHVLENIKGLTKESAIAVEGHVYPNPKADKGIEVHPDKIAVVAKSKSDLPITVAEKKDAAGSTGNINLAKRLDWRSIDLRRPRMQAIFKIQSAIVEGMTQALVNDGYAQVFTPCILGSASEGGSEVFSILYFDREAFLRQDPQLHRQLTIAGGITKIFDLGPAWRAEQSHTAKHLCEHRVCAVEKGFIKDEHDVMRIEEMLMVAAVKKVNEKCKDELDFLGVKLNVPAAPFPELTFPELYDILKERGKELAFGEDLDSESEKILWEYVKEKYNAEFYFINGFPSNIKPFYVMKRDDDPRWARSIDLYYKGIELSSGGQREHRHDKLMQTVKEKKMKESEIEWFTKIFEYGVPTHGGFALGIERLTQSFLSIENIRDCVLFPRDPERLVP
jgi:nondiscriminating aspartyl-tRNA synthetase